MCFVLFFAANYKTSIKTIFESQSSCLHFCCALHDILETTKKMQKKIKIYNKNKNISVRPVYIAFMFKQWYNHFFKGGKELAESKLNVFSRTIYLLNASKTAHITSWVGLDFFCDSASYSDSKIVRTRFIASS